MPQNSRALGAEGRATHALWRVPGCSAVVVARRLAPNKGLPHSAYVIRRVYTEIRAERSIRKEQMDDKYRVDYEKYIR